MSCSFVNLLIWQRDTMSELWFIWTWCTELFLINAAMVFRVSTVCMYCWWEKRREELGESCHWLSPEGKVTGIMMVEECLSTLHTPHPSSPHPTLHSLIPSSPILPCTWVPLSSLLTPPPWHKTNSLTPPHASYPLLPLLYLLTLPPPHTYSLLHTILLTLPHSS